MRSIFIERTRIALVAAVRIELRVDGASVGVDAALPKVPNKVVPEAGDDGRRTSGFAAQLAQYVV